MESASVAWLDIAVSLPLIWAAWRGFQRGFLTQVAVFLGLGMGLLAGYHGSARIAETLRESWQLNGAWVGKLAFFLAFVGVLLLVRILAKVVEKGAKLALLNWVNRLLGVVFSTLSGALLMGVGFYFLNSLAGWREWLPDGAATHAPLYQVVEGIPVALVPELQTAPKNALEQPAPVSQPR